MHHHLLTIFMLKCVCLCVSRAQKKNYFYVFREISHEHRTELFFHQHLQASWPKERSFLLSSSSSRDRSRMCVKENFCNFFFFILLKNFHSLSFVAAVAFAAILYYICRILCVKKEGKATMTTETENPRRMLAIG